MTRALINSLNIMQDTSLPVVNKMPKTEGVDFGKIFEKKTDKTNCKSESDKFQNRGESEKNKISDNSNNNSENIKKDADFELSVQKNNKQETDIKEQTTVTKTDAKEEIEKTDETENSSNNELSDIIDEIITTEEEITTITEEIITTITEEDPTMYKELIPLENPTVLLMQSQISNAVNLTSEKEKQNEVNEGINLKTENQDLVNDAIFKQFEDETKELNVFRFAAPKENTNTKETVKPSNVISEKMVKELEVEVVSSQSENSADSSAGDFLRQSPQEQAARVMIQNDVKYEPLLASSLKGTVPTKAEIITPGKIIEQITKQLEGMYNNSKLNMILNPGSLGKVNLQLVNSKDGLMAQFTVTTQEARELLLKGLDGLKESLLAQGVNVDNVSVKLAEAEGEYQSDYTEQEGSRGGNKQQGFKKQKEGEKQFEQMMFELENNDNV